MRYGTAENAGKTFAPMLNDFTGADKVYIACGYTDLRKGIDGLARLEQEKPVLDALLSWANAMQAKTAPKSATCGSSGRV